MANWPEFRQMERMETEVNRHVYNDQNWACGWHPDDDKRRDISKWRGKNLLGFALMEVRAQIRAESGENSGNSSI